MSRSIRSRQRWLVTAATILAAASGCTDSTLLSPTAASRAGNPNGNGNGGGGGGQKRLSIVGLNLSSTSLVIGGARVGYTVTVENKGASVSNVVLQGAIVQGSASQPAGGLSASCIPSSPGVVPKGSCQMTFTAGASNANGGAPLVPGAASFVLTMSLEAGGVSTVLDQESVPVTLVGITRTISSLSLSKTTLAITDGTDPQPDITNIAAVLQNTGSELSPVRLRADFVQGTVVHNSGFLPMTCTDPGGNFILPSGTCTINWFAVATNVISAGPGTLAPGPATFVLSLILGDDGATTVLDSKTVPVTLVGSSTLGITSLVLNSTTLAIGGDNVDYDVTISNPTSQLDEVFIQGEMLQNGNLAGAGGTDVRCPPNSADGVLPVGTCAMQFSARASNQSVSPNALVPGAATFRLTMYKGFGAAREVLDTKSVDVTLVAGPPEVTAVVFFAPENNVTLSTTVATDYNVTLVNSGSSITGMSVRSQVVQTLNGVTSTRNVSDVPVTCSGVASGTLPNGACTFQVTTFVSNSAPGSGPDLQPENDASYIVTLYQNGVPVNSLQQIVHLKVQLF